MGRRLFDLFHVISLISSSMGARLEMNVDGSRVGEDLVFDPNSDLRAVALGYLERHPEFVGGDSTLDAVVTDLVNSMEMWAAQEKIGQATTLSINGINPEFLLSSIGDPRTSLSTYCGRFVAFGILLFRPPCPRTLFVHSCSL